MAASQQPCATPQPTHSSLPPSSEESEPETTTPPPHPYTPRERFHLRPLSRYTLATLLSTTCGFTLGVSQGGRGSALRFRAENSHRMPTSQRGWFLYHKHKNWVVMRDAIREGFRMGFRVLPWTVGFFVLEEAVDQTRAPVRVDAVMFGEGDAEAGPGEVEGKRGEEWRREVEGRQDFLSTMVAGVGTAGGFSLWNRLPIPTAARMAKFGLGAGLGFGLAQDAIHLLQGQRLAYVDGLKQLLGMPQRRTHKG
ncbi:MAG: hypothetical protein M1831_006395 [Alyxoria varia]|nr:MAG: hypothetical protein M1831_006395 [Alyxoria varia]